MYDLIAATLSHDIHSFPLDVTGMSYDKVSRSKNHRIAMADTRLIAELPTPHDGAGFLRVTLGACI